MENLTSSTVQKMNNGLVTTTGNIIVASDFHIPQQSNPMITSLINCAYHNDIETLVINGDFFNQDVFSRFDRKETNAGWILECDEVNRVSFQLQNTFKRIIFILGNHDARLLKLTRYILSFEQIIKMTIDDYNPKQIIVTDYDHIIHNGCWRICHPHEYSKRPTAKAKAFSDKYNMNTIVGHSHMLNKLTTNIGGKIRHSIDGGCMLDPAMVEYNQINTTSYPNWKQGFVLLEGNDPTIISPNPPSKQMTEY